jgi:dienelactone hydrolase
MAASASALRLECEEFSGLWRTQTNISGYSGRGFVVSNADGVAKTAMTRTVDIPAVGCYLVWARGYEGDGLDRRWRVQVGEALLDETHTSRKATGWSWQRCGQVDLRAGDVEIRLIDTGDSFEVADAIMLTTDPNLAPTVEEGRWRVLDEADAKTMVFREIMARTRAYAAAMPVCRSLDGWRQRAAWLRPRVMRALGLDPLPERTPLNVRILGETQLDGYRIQGLTFESRPGLLVTANVYVPSGPGPFPLVLCPVGHFARGKNEPTPAARSHGLAKLGYITITYDPFGQEERAIPGNEHTEHWRLILTGHTNMSIMVWDTVRALDYMLTRPDVDGSRIACTGASGGGLNTLYFSVADHRLGVAVPVVYITQWSDFLGTGAEHCPCSHVPGLGAFADMGEMTALFAPKPQMYINAKADPQFTTAGAQHAEAQARVVYDLFGADDRLVLKCFEGDHDYSRPMRESLYGFVAQHLLGQDDGRPIPEPAFTPEPPESEWCFPSGKIPATTKTVRQFALEWAEAAIARLPTPKGFDAAGCRKALVSIVHPPSDTTPRLAPCGSFSVNGFVVRRLKLEAQPGITLPALFAAAEPRAPVVVIADGSPDPSSAEPLLRAAREAGLAALYVSPRGTGETAWDEHVICTDNVLLGDSILGQRAFDLAQAARALQAEPGMEHTDIGLLALGPEAGLYGLFAQALWSPQPYMAAAVGPVMGSYREAFGPGIPMAAYVNRILEVADIPQVVALASGRPLRIAFAHDDYSRRRPEWADYAAETALVVGELSVEEGLSFLEDELTRTE